MNPIPPQTVKGDVVIKSVSAPAAVPNKITCKKTDSVEEMLDPLPVSR
jgi:hypothetical protein